LGLARVALAAGLGLFPDPFFPAVAAGVVVFLGVLEDALDTELAGDDAADLY